MTRLLRIIKFFGRISDSMLQLFFKKLPLLSFGMLSKKNICNYVKGLLKCTSLFNHTPAAMWGQLLFHMLEAKQHNARLDTDMKIQLSFLKRDIKKIYKKCKTKSLLSLFFVCLFIFRVGYLTFELQYKDQIMVSYHQKIIHINI